jgi:hypothetical protein
MRRFEYKCVLINLASPDARASELNSYGDEGWELVAIWNAVHYFKREIA